MRTYLSLILVAAACGHPGKAPEPTLPPAPPAPTGPTGQAPPAPSNDALLVAEAKQFAAKIEVSLRTLMVDGSQTDWDNETDITPAHEELAAKSAAKLATGITDAIHQSHKFDSVRDKLDPQTRRELLLLQFAGQPAPDDAKQADELAKVAAEMTSIYGKGKVCTSGRGGKATCKDLDAVSKVLQSSREPAQLLAAWKGWHDTVGHAEKDLFTKYVDLANAGARGVGFKDVASMWKSGYDMPEAAFVADTDRLWGQVKPLYDQLHCYTRRRLNKLYGDKVVPKTGLIPAHLLGNMWAQAWGWLYPELEPYKGIAPIDVTATLKKKLSTTDMVKMGEGFYVSLGFDPLPPTFWERSMFEKPKGKEVVCHASAWDVTFSNDLRIKMCIDKTQEDLVTIHHELGHDYYYHSYYQLPILFQSGANDGFHEAIGDTIALSMTPQYLHDKGLLGKVEKNDKATINQQMRIALDKIAFLPFGLMMDKWRWDAFSGAVTPDQYNDHWWKLRAQYQGIAPPIARTAADFDPGAKYHVAANVPYMRYFLAAVLQFQFHRALCKKAGFTGPLNECSIYGNKEAGAALQKLLARGASQPWQDTLFELTGSREMDATAILEYFAPLQKWLEEQNKGEQCGW